MHSGLSSAERVKLSKRFREDPEKTALKVLVIMYDVSALGIDLSEECHFLCVFSPAKKTLIRLLVVCRVVRVSLAEISPFVIRISY
jgi:hypothetical protein